MKRDVSLVFAISTKPSDVTKLIGENDDLEAFSTAFEAKGGLHGSVKSFPLLAPSFTQTQILT